MKVIIFGTGIYAKNIFSKVLESHEIIGFLDNQVAKWGRFFDSEQKYLIHNPNDILNLQYDLILIASAERSFTMKQQLLQLGVEEKAIIEYPFCRKEEISLCDFLEMQVNVTGENNRMDIVVRYLAIEEYYGKNDFGFSLYKNMQKKRQKLGEEEAEARVEIFKNLITSFEKNKFIKNNPILCDERMRIIDGAHRVACSLYFSIPVVSILVVPYIFECCYDKEWFVQNGFTQKERDVILGKESILFKMLLEKNG